MTSSYRYEPVVALDIDGVLRIPQPRDGARTEVIAAEITMRRSAFPKQFHRSPPWDEDGMFTATQYFSAAGVRWVQSLLHQGVDVRWCTTWGSFANSYFTDPLQIPELPVIWDAPRWNEDAVEWKTRIIADASHGRPVLWGDDNTWEEALRYTHTPRALTGVRRIDPWFGITAADVAAMNSWITLAGSPEGHDELHRQWRRQRDRQRRLGVAPFPSEWRASIR